MFKYLFLFSLPLLAQTNQGIRINNTVVQGGINGDYLKVNPNGTVGQGTVSGGSSPAGSAGCVQLYGTSTTFACDAAFLDIAASHLVEIGGAPNTPFAGLYIGPNESTLPAVIQGAATPTTLLLTSTSAINTSVLGIESTSAGVQGVYIAMANPNPFAIEIDTHATSDLGDGQNTQAIDIFPDVDTVKAGYVQGYGFYAPASFTNGGSATTLWSYYSSAIGGLADNPYSFWHDERGVFRIKADNTFNSVYQAIPALYNPQFTKYTPGAANFERCIPGCQWESNEAWFRTEAGGTGVARRLGLGALAGLDLSTNDVANPFTMPKMSAAAVAPGAAKCDVRLLAGTTGSSGKIVINCGTSATEVTIVDNVGTGF